MEFVPDQNAEANNNNMNTLTATRRDLIGAMHMA